MVSRWLDMHLETFVRPHLGYVPDMKGPRKLKKDPSAWTPRHCKALWGVWVEAKRKAKAAGDLPILLAGRDVWLLEIMARLDDFPTIFQPEISSPVANYYGEMRRKPKCPDFYKRFEKCYLVDTGFQGSVPKNLGIDNYHLIRWNATQLKPPALKPHQLFPYAKRASQVAKSKYPDGTVKEWETEKSTGCIKTAGGSTIDDIAGMMENTAKYWTSGIVNIEYDRYSGNPVYNAARPIVQTFDDTSFPAAAVITRWIVHNLTRPVEKHRVFMSSLGRGI